MTASFASVKQSPRRVQFKSTGGYFVVFSALSGRGPAAREHGDKPAVIMGGTGAMMSYAELERRSNQVAHLFRARGLRAGDRIAVLMVNELDLFPVVWAAQRAGLYYAPVNWHLSAEEAAYPRGRRGGGRARA